MQPEHEEGEPQPLVRVRPSRDPQVDLADVLFTLDICRRALPWDAHPEHFDRLRRIERLVRWEFERQAR